jgi:DNA-binding GntR family transcriptional regulator
MNVVSKYPVIKATLKARLLSGAYRAGESLPSESHLADEFHVSRMTARRAMDELEREGYIYRVQGSGSYPTGKRFRQGVFRIRALDEIALERGEDAVPFTRVLRSGLTTSLPAMVVEALELGPGAAAVEIVRLRGVNEEPVLLERRYLRVDRAEGLLGVNLAIESIHDLIVSRLRVDITRVEQSLEVVSLDQDEARLLGLPVGAASFLMRRVSFDAVGPLSHARYWVRGDRGAFVSAFEP